MTIQQKIDKYINQFTAKEFGDLPTRIIFEENASEELRSSVRNAHGDSLPDDWVFDTYLRILQTMNDYEMDNDEKLEDYRSEIVDGLVSIYTSDLTDWLGSNNSNVEYLTEALEEFEPKDGFQALAMAQYQAIDEIYSEVVSLLTK